MMCTKLYKILTITVLLLLSKYSWAQSNEVELLELTRLPLALKECSGMIIDSNSDIWAINDSGNKPFIFKISREGQINSFYRVSGSYNYDWEALAYDGDSIVFIGDIGDNALSRKKYRIYRVNIKEASENKSLTSEVIEFSLADETSFNFESLAYLDNQLYIFSKTLIMDSMSVVYRLPTLPGEYTVSPADTLTLPVKNKEIDVITGATFYNKRLFLLTYNNIYLLPCISDFKKVVLLKTNHISQKESICLGGEQSLLISDELFRNSFGGFLYTIDISRISPECD